MGSSAAATWRITLMKCPGVYEKRASTVEAWQWDGDPACAELICEWIEDNGGFAAPHTHENLIVLGDNIAPVNPGDWVIRDKFNEFWPIGDDLFPAVYKSILASPR